MRRILAGYVSIGWGLMATVTGLTAPAGAQTSEVVISRSFVRATGTPVTATDTFPACDPAGRFSLVVDNGPGGQPKVTSGTVTVNGLEVVHDSDFKQQVPHLERPLSRIAAANRLDVRLGSQPGGTIALSVVAVQSCIRITEPAAGAALTSTEILVQGTLGATATSGVAVIVNGIVAAVGNGRFAAMVRVDSQITSLAANMVDAVGITLGSHTIPVTVPTQMTEPPVRLVAGPASGVRPLTVSFALTSTAPIAQIALDLKGIGAVDFQGAILAGQSFSYDQAGLYLPTVTATDASGSVHTATTVVLVEDPQVVTARFQALWAGFNGRLQTGDLPGALAFLAPVLRPRFQTVFQQLGSALPGIAAGFGNLHVTDQSGDLAEAVLVQVEANGPALYFIQFRRDGLGRWLIEEM